MGPPWGIEPTTHHPMSRWSTTELHLTPYLFDTWQPTLVNISSQFLSYLYFRVKIIELGQQFYLGLRWGSLLIQWKGNGRHLSSLCFVCDKLLLSILLFVLQVPALCEDLLSSVDQPLKIARDKVSGKDYLSVWLQQRWGLIQVTGYHILVINSWLVHLIW